MPDDPATTPPPPNNPILNAPPGGQVVVADIFRSPGECLQGDEDDEGDD